MKNLKCNLFVLGYICTTFSIIHAQNEKLWDHTTVHFGFSVQEQDRRLFDFPDAEGIIEREDSDTDIETHLYIQKKLIGWWRMDFSTGLGYMRYQTKFSRPVNHNYFTQDNTRPLIHIEKYVIHKLSVPASLNAYLHKNESIFLNLTGWASFNINKRLASKPNSNFGGNRFKLDFNGLELNPGLGFRASRFQVQLNYRVLHFYKIDGVIFNDILFNTQNPPFLEEKYESRNLDKVWLTVGYHLTK